jgi:hypothetical protein
MPTLALEILPSTRAYFTDVVKNATIFGKQDPGTEFRWKAMYHPML